jgi:seryl-tRNA synthetase
VSLDQLFDASLSNLVLAQKIPSALAAEIEKASVYFSPDLECLRVSPDLGSVTIKAHPGADLDALRSKVLRAIGSMVASARDIPTKIYFERKRAKILARGVDAELTRRGWVFEHGHGQASLFGPPLRLLQLLDQRFAELYRSHFGAIDRMYPAMVSPALLQRVGYFSSHPNAASFVCHLAEDFDELEQFRRANSGDGFVAPQAGVVAPPHRCLNPAACFPCYESLQNRRLENESMALTWMGRVFRYESKNMTGLERLWEFNVRELVFIGSEAFTLDAREKARQLVKDLAEEWDLDCRIESATDAFFPTVYGPQSFWQRVKDVKYEIRLAVESGAQGEDRSIAAGSINLHGPFFGERFGILLPNGDTASTACVGWGLERWVLALFTQHGFEPSQWPEGLRGIF